MPHPLLNGQVKRNQDVLSSISQKGLTRGSKDSILSANDQRPDDAALCYNAMTVPKEEKMLTGLCHNLCYDSLYGIISVALEGVEGLNVKNPDPSALSATAVNSIVFLFTITKKISDQIGRRKHLMVDVITPNPATKATPFFEIKTLHTIQANQIATILAPYHLYAQTKMHFPNHEVIAVPETQQKIKMLPIMVSQPKMSGPVFSEENKQKALNLFFNEIDLKKPITLTVPDYETALNKYMKTKPGIELGVHITRLTTRALVAKQDRKQKIYFFNPVETVKLRVPNIELAEQKNAPNAFENDPQIFIAKNKLPNPEASTRLLNDLGVKVFKIVTLSFPQYQFLASHPYFSLTKNMEEKNSYFIIAPQTYRGLIEKSVMSKDFNKLNEKARIIQNVYAKYKVGLFHKATIQTLEASLKKVRDEQQQLDTQAKAAPVKTLRSLKTA